MIPKVLKAAFDFRGRTRRRDFWLLVALSTVEPICLGAMASDYEPGDNPTNAWEWVAYVAFYVFFVLIVISGIRRLHDINRRGWWLLLAFSCLGAFYVLALMSTDGTEGSNRFGPDPKERQPRDDRPTNHHPPWVGQARK